MYAIFALIFKVLFLKITEEVLCIKVSLKRSLITKEKTPIITFGVP